MNGQLKLNRYLWYLSTQLSTSFQTNFQFCSTFCCITTRFCAVFRHSYVSSAHSFWNSLVQQNHAIKISHTLVSTSVSYLCVRFQYLGEGTYENLEVQVAIQGILNDDFSTKKPMVRIYQKIFFLVVISPKNQRNFFSISALAQRYTYRVLQTIQMKLILFVSGQSPPFWAALKLL